jgi:Flp pilus assembly protein TadB
MPVFAIVLLVVGAVALALGVVLFANGVRARARPHDGEPGGPEGTKQELQQLPWKELFSMMRTSVKVFTNSDAGHDDRLRAGGAFCFLVGIVLVCLAVVAFVAWMF